MSSSGDRVAQGADALRQGHQLGDAVRDVPQIEGVGPGALFVEGHDGADGGNAPAARIRRAADFFSKEAGKFEPMTWFSFSKSFSWSL